MNGLPNLGKCEEVGGKQYGLTLYTLAESIQATRVLEIGAGWGYSAAVFSASLQNRLPASLLSVDNVPERFKPELGKFITETGIEWTLVEADSRRMIPPKDMDLLYIDTDPSNVCGDLERYYDSVRDGGLVIIDGVGAQSGPTELVEGSELSFICLPYNKVSSHAIHRKPIPLEKRAGLYEGKCFDCDALKKCGSWMDIDAWSFGHAETTGHALSVQAVPRNLHYKVFVPEASRRAAEKRSAQKEA